MEFNLTVQKFPDEKLAYKNCVFVPKSLNTTSNYMVLHVDSKKFHFYCAKDSSTKPNCIAMTLAQRKWTNVSLDQAYRVTFIQLPKNAFISKVVLQINFLHKSKATEQLIDSEKLVGSFLQQFSNYPLTVGQIMFFNCDLSLPPFEITVIDIEVGALGSFLDAQSAEEGNVTQGTKARQRSTATLTRIAMTTNLIISPNWDFNEMGIGGLDKEFSVIFRRAFASRLFPPEIILQLGMKHVRGILLFGPPGTGKTLMARQIGKMLNAREPKIVHGPDILNKFVGESEANIRKLFADAEEEQKKAGINSGLHIIIFDEIDAICKKRGTATGGTGVHDTVVNQLLSKIDGVEQLNNVLIIGMTNRKDLIDDALLRPGRLEVQMEINLPDEKGRLQILSIHTANLKKYDKLDPSVDLDQLAAETKNYSGAEIEGLVKAATSIAMNRAVKLEGKVKLDPKGMENLTVTMGDFEYALRYDIKPMFGASTGDLSLYVANGIVNWCDAIQHLISDGHLIIEQTKNGGIISPVSLLLCGEVGTGKTALASHLALSSNFPLIKLCSADQMVGFSEFAKCQILKEIFDDACKSELSCIVLDNIERILEYVPIGPRFSNTILQALLVLLNKRLPLKHKLLVIATTSCPDVMEDMGVIQIFTRTLKVPIPTKIKELELIIKHYSFFKDDVWARIVNNIKDSRLNLDVI
ncbi:Vesicle-fusing ATPase [Thelohanellus kitauei]|uniref:Vesicle-fusing ATPase n=1 Tax=Thelohanellus kitauei TaxID=669202 RepID=A0A0C2II78_THEKT|nr:Vesicle-fusing ATPase [Thelohanellus kitauei]